MGDFKLKESEKKRMDVCKSPKSSFDKGGTKGKKSI